MRVKINKVSVNISNELLARFKKYSDENGLSMSNTLVLLSKQTLDAYDGLETLRHAMEQQKSDSIERKAIEENAKAGTL